MNKPDIEQLLRSNIRDLVAYSSARSEYAAPDVIYLDANENSFGSALEVPYNRYPDPLQLKLKESISAIKGIKKECQFLGNGSDEPIDLLIRSFCNPGKDNIVIFPPTYGMYEVSAKINDVAIKEVLLSNNFQIDLNKTFSIIDEYTKLIFICSPNNPSGNIIDPASIKAILENFKGLVILDEAYIDFAKVNSLLDQIGEYPNLVILQTFSKAWGMAGLRLGMAFASPDIINVLNKVKAPYNINIVTQQLALNALSSEAFVTNCVEKIIKERMRLDAVFASLPFVDNVFASDANFILIRVQDAAGLYNYLKQRSIIVRNRSNMSRCENCLRITVGTEEENNLLITTLKQYANA